MTHHEPPPGMSASDSVPDMLLAPLGQHRAVPHFDLSLWLHCYTLKAAGLIWPIDECAGSGLVVLDPGCDLELGAGLGGPDRR